MKENIVSTYWHKLLNFHVNKIKIYLTSFGLHNHDVMIVNLIFSDNCNVMLHYVILMWRKNSEIYHKPGKSLARYLMIIFNRTGSCKKGEQSFLTAICWNKPFTF